MSVRPRRRYPSLVFRRLRAFTIVALAAVLVLVVVRLAGGSTSSDPVAAAPLTAVPSTAAAPTTSDPASSDASSPPPSSPPPSSPPASSPATPGAGRSSSTPTDRRQAIDDAVADWHAEQGGRLAVSVLDTETGRTSTYGDDSHGYATASIVKVDILATLLLQEHGNLSAGQRATAALMIRQSDNGAASSLWRQIGGERGLDAANRRFGLKHTHGGTLGRWGLTRTTTADQLRVLRVVFTDDSPLTDDARSYVRSLMGSVSPDQDWGVTAADSRGDTHAFVKNGWLPRTGGWIVNSVGKVEHDGHPLLLAALSEGGSTEQRGISVVESVATDAARDVTGT